MSLKAFCRSVSVTLAVSGLVASFTVVGAPTTAVIPPPALTVSFVHPEAYTDAVIATPSGPDLNHLEVQKAIRQHLETLATDDLPAGDSLEVQILDVDLAGRARPVRSGVGSDFRVVREQDWPRIKLHYTLRRGGQVLANEQTSLADLSFLHHNNRYPSGDPLRYEKALLDDWFANRIVARH